MPSSARIAAISRSMRAGLRGRTGYRYKEFSCIKCQSLKEETMPRRLSLAAPAAPAPSPEPQDAHERAVTAFEYAVWHLGSAFARWRRDCLALLPDGALSGAEASLLHVIHINGTAKGL